MHLEFDIGPVDGRLVTPFDATGRHVVDKLLCIPDPRAERDASFKVKLWDGMTHFMDPATGAFPAGLWHRLKMRLEKRGHTFTVLPREQAVHVVPSPIEADYLAGIDMRDYQLESSNAALLHRRGLLWLATNAGKCLPAGTPIQLSDGTQLGIECVTVGTRVLSVQADTDLKVVSSVVEAVLDNGIRPTVVVTVAGRRVQCTANHPFLVGRGQWKEAGQLTYGDLVAFLGSYEESDITWQPVESVEESDSVRTYDLQVAGTHNFIANGVVVHNTECLSAIIGKLVRECDHRVLVIVPNTNLLHQTAARIHKRLGEDVRVGRVGDGVREIDCEVVVGTYQSLAPAVPDARGRTDDPGLATFIAQCQGVFVDETHHATSSSIKSILRACVSADYRIGLTGTVDKRDKRVSSDDSARDHRWRMESYLGPVLYRVSNEFLIDQGFSAKPHVIAITDRSCFGPTVVTPKPRPGARPINPYSAVFRQAAVEDAKWCRNVALVVRSLLAANRPPFVFSHSVLHGQAIAAQCQVLNVPHEVLNGGDDTAGRQDALRRFSKHKDFAVITSSLPHHELLVIRESGVICQIPIGDLVRRFIPGIGSVLISGIEVLSVDRSGVAAFRPLTGVMAHARPSSVGIVTANLGSGLSVDVTDNHSLIEVASWSNVQAREATQASAVTALTLPEEPQVFDVAGKLSGRQFFVEIDGWTPPRRFGSAPSTFIAYIEAVAGLGPIPLFDHPGRRARMLAKVRSFGSPLGLLAYLRGVQSGSIRRIWSGAAGRWVVRVDCAYASVHHQALSTLGNLYVRGARSKSRIPARIPLDESLSEFLGLFVAEGCASVGGTVNPSIVAALAGNPAVRVSGTVEVVASVHNRELAHMVMSRICPGYVRTTPRQIICNSNVFAAFLLYVAQVGTYAVGKQVPPQVFSAPSAIKRSFLQGLYFGDGSSFHGLQYATSVSRKLIQGVNLLVRSLGDRRVSIGFTRFDDGVRQDRWDIYGPDGAVVGFGPSRRKRLSGRTYYDLPAVGDTHTCTVTTAPSACTDSIVYDVSVQSVENFVAGPGLVVCHNSIFDEGADVPDIRAIVLAGARKSCIEILQRVGRGVRKKADDNTVVVVDFDPLHSTMLHDHYMARMATYRDEGFKVTTLGDMMQFDALISQ